MAYEHTKTRRPDLLEESSLQFAIFESGFSFSFHCVNIVFSKILNQVIVFSLILFER
jgi:hypothetical protein